MLFDVDGWGTYVGSNRKCLAVATVLASLAALTSAVVQTPVAGAAPTVPSGRVVGNADPALGNGLGRLLSRPGVSARVAGRSVVDQNRLTIRDSRGRVLIDVTPQAGADRAAFRRQAAALGLVVTATDASFGTLEGYAPLSSVRALQALPGTGAIKQVLRPHTDVGAVTSQGVVFQRVDKVLAKGIDGRGLTVGVLSDSYDTATTTLAGDPLTDHAAQDIKSGDLPGPGNKQYPTPVTVLQDFPGADATDEGRAMLQVVHDVAPAARLCFATADAGEVQFANNIRALADPKGRCKADVIVDDVAYLDEPMFSDGILSAAVDDVAAAGVSYFSSAGNEGDPAAWASDVHLIPAAQGVKGTNLKLGDVPADLYSGGLQDMNPGAGTDVAQTLTVGDDGGTLDLQWNDPIDYNGASIGDPYFTAAGSLTAPGQTKTYAFTPTAAQIGTLAQFRTDGVPSGSTDLVLTVTRPDGTQVGPIDTSTSPEVADVRLTLPGTYTITIGQFSDSTGPFTVDVRPILAPSKVTTDFNVLLFDTAGNYLGEVGDDNRLTGLPEELAALGGVSKLQLVIARAGTGPTPVTKLRYVIFDGWCSIVVGRGDDDAATAGPGSALGAIRAADPASSRTSRAWWPTADR